MNCEKDYLFPDDIEDGENISQATHQGTLVIGDKKLSCAVLKDGTRIITEKAVFSAFNRPARGRSSNRAINVPSFLDAQNLQPFISQEFKEQIKLIKYFTKTKRMATGYDAKIIPCKEGKEVYKLVDKASLEIAKGLLASTYPALLTISCPLVNSL